MISVGYDPISRELLLDIMPDVEPLSIRTDGVVFKYYQPEGGAILMVPRERRMEVELFPLPFQPEALTVHQLSSKHLEIEGKFVPRGRL